VRKSILDEFYIAVIDFLEQSKVPYLIIGGLAVSVIGEPRMTQDIDLIVSLKKQNVHALLESAINSSFELNMERELQRVKETGTFRLNRGHFHADMIIASTSLEESAFTRAQRIKLVNKIASFPSPEDLVLFKIVVGRDKDMLDARAIVIRHKMRLDRGYLKRWAQSISDEAEDMTVWNRLMELLEE
jgi:predicted nucleotidyltransferase